MKLNCVSLFDGMSCLRLALEEEGFEIHNYYASEIDKPAIKVSKDNWFDVQHMGDVRNVSGLTLPKIDLLAGGSPCQGFSFAGKQLNFDDPRSKLFFEYVRILKELRQENPDIYFLLENVKMEKSSQAIITQYLGVEPIEINSALVSAQNRKRLYWTNIPYFGPPKDLGLVLRDILETGSVDDKYILSPDQISKLVPSTSSQERDIKILYHRKDFRRNLQVYDINGKTECLDTGGGGGRFPSVMLKVGNTHPSGSGTNGKVYDADYKCPTLTTGKGEGIKVRISEEFYLTPEQVERGFHQAEGKTWSTGNKMGKMDFPNNPDKKAKTLCTVSAKGGRETNHIHDGYYYRRLTPVECERLQTVRDKYTACVSNSQRYKMLGNGWNIKTIRHLIRPIHFADLFK